MLQVHNTTLENMTCGHCRARVTQALKSVDPQARVEVDLGRRQVRVTTASPLSELTDALADAGYPASASSVIN